MRTGPSGLPVVRVVPRYMEHKGGTKFYEAIGIEFNGVTRVVRRWGPMEVFKKRDAGPDIKIDTLNGGTTAWNGVESVVAEKTKSSKGYNTVTVNHGFHRAMTDAGYDLEADEFLTKLVEHYGAGRAEHIKSLWADLEDIDLSSAIIPDENANDVPVKPAEIERGDDWGAW